MAMMLDKKMQAVDKAVSMYEQIKEACVRPDRAISGDTLIMYNELVDWGFLDKYNISDAENKFLYVTIIAMQITKNEAVALDKNAKQGKSKWQIIQEALNKSNKANKKK